MWPALSEVSRMVFEERGKTMKTRNLISGVLSCAATAAITLALLLPAGLNADGEKQDVTPTIMSPAITVDGCEFTLVTDNRQLKAGDKPTATLKAENKTDKEVSITVNLTMLGRSLASPMSRVGPMPRQMWKQEYPLVLQAGEKKEIAINTNTAIIDQTSVDFRMATGTSYNSTLSLLVEQPVTPLEKQVKGLAELAQSANSNRQAR